MKYRGPTEESFLKDVATHQMTVLLDNGIYRHVQFRRPDTYCMSFELVTWPGYLAYAGDMGEFVFSRLPDMFEFFRDKREGALRINTSYWAEKCRAPCGTEGVKIYSADRFREIIKDWLDQREASAVIREAVDDEVLPLADDGIYPAMRAAIDFVHEGEHVFQDFYEVDPTEYTYRFVWCCYALAWGIRRYDASKILNDAMISSADAAKIGRGLLHD